MYSWTLKEISQILDFQFPNDLPFIVIFPASKYLTSTQFVRQVTQYQTT